MPQIIQNELGEDVEVYTADEIAAQKEAAIEEYKQSNPDKGEEVTALQAELATANEALKKFENKDLNFGNLRTQKEAAEKKVEELTAQIDTKIDTAKKEVLESVLQDHYADTLKSLAGDDEELQKKIEFHYKRLADPASTKTDVTKKLTDAWVLATKPEEPNALTSTVISSGGVSKPKINSAAPFSPDEKALGQKLAEAGGMTLKDEDFSK